MVLLYSRTEIEEGIKYKIFNEDNGKQLTWKNVLSSNNEEFIDTLISIFKSYKSPFFWELPPIKSSLLENTPFEMVLINSNVKNENQDNYPFYKYIISSNNTVNMFKNLKGDALLFIPAGNFVKQEKTNYTNIYTFVNSASSIELFDYFSKLFLNLRKFFENPSDKYTWISTSGLGVFWLHTRIEHTPKYYKYKPYKHIDNQYK